MSYFSNFSLEKGDYLNKISNLFSRMIRKKYISLSTIQNCNRQHSKIFCVWGKGVRGSGYFSKNMRQDISCIWQASKETYDRASFLKFMMHM